MNKISEDLTLIIQKKSAIGHVSLSDFTDHFGNRSIAFIISLLALPIALPFTPPGINTPFAVACIILAFNFGLNKQDFSLPKFIASKKLPFKPDGGFFKAMTKLLTMVEIFIKPRLSWVTESKFSKPLLAVGLICASVVMLIPLPIINSVSSLIVLLIALGIVSKDGLMALTSSVLGFLLLATSVGLIIYGIIIGQSFFVQI
jgi:hypothetical protein